MTGTIGGSGARRVAAATLLCAIAITIAIAAPAADQPRDIRFERGASEGRVEGALTAGQVQVYRLSARQGQRLEAVIESPSDQALFWVYPPGSRWRAATGEVEGEPLTGGAGTRSLRIVLPATGNYLFVVGVKRGDSGYALRVSVAAADAAAARPAAAAVPSAGTAPPAATAGPGRFVLGFYSCVGAGSREQLLLMPSGRFIEARFGSADEKAPKAAMRAGRWGNERGAELDVVSAWLPSSGWTRVKQKEGIEYRVTGASGDRFVVDLVDAFGGKVMVTEHRQCLRIGMGVDAEATALQQSVPESAFGGR